jgi:hypothetical protein
MEPYKPPQKRNPEPETSKSWIAENWWVLLATGALTAIGSVIVTHYLGGALRRREDQARLRGEMEEAEALGQERVAVNNPEPDLFDRMSGIETQLSNMSRHFGVSG